MTLRITNLPSVVHLEIQTYLRPTDLSRLQQTCKTFNDRNLIHDTIQLFATVVYPPELTKGFDAPAVTGFSNTNHTNKNHTTTVTCDNNNNNDEEHSKSIHLTYESLRNMEMLVVARVLSRPDPHPTSLNDRHLKSGYFYVSKSWCRAALRWLEYQAEERREKAEEALWLQQQQQQHQQQASMDSHDSKNYPNNHQSSNAKKGNKKSNHHQHHFQKKLSPKPKLTKKQKQKRKKNIDASPPPWPNVNHDITCEHGGLCCSASNHNYTTTTNHNSQQRNPHNNNNNNNSNNNNYQTYSSPSTAKALRARRIMDKQAWRILKKLYPDGTQLSMMEGECVICNMEAETLKKNAEQLKIKAMEERKKPLLCPLVRAFYSRKNQGVPAHCLVHPTTSTPTSTSNTNNNNTSIRNSMTASVASLTPISSCPLLPGIYYVLPRAWCHRWRKYIKTGEGGRPCAPDSSACLCDAHKLPLLPPHLESYLYGETISLLDMTRYITIEDDELDYDDHHYRSRNVATIHTISSNTTTTTNNPTAMNEIIQSLRASGLSPVEIQAQQVAMMQMEQAQQARLNLSTTTEEARIYMNEQLDKENKVVVEILTCDEFEALEKWWPEIHSSYALKFAVVPSESSSSSSSCDILWTTQPCRDCDASPRSDISDVVLRNRLKMKTKHRYHHKR